MSSPTPPGTPKPASKWASRMGAAVRRSSTILTLGRPATPSSEVDSDSKSLRRSTSREVPQTPPPPMQSPPAIQSPPAVRVATAQPLPPSMPTPIAESPVREAAAMQSEVVGPSPLVRSTTEPAAEVPASKIVESPEPILESAAVKESAPADEATSPVGYVPPPVIDSSIGNPGAFTDLPEDLPQPTEVTDPFAATNTGPPAPAVVETEAEPTPAAEVALSDTAPVAQEEATESAAVTVAEVSEHEAAAVEESVPPSVADPSAANPGAFTENVEEIPQPVVEHDPFESTQRDSQLEAPELEHSASYFDKPMAESMIDFDPHAPESDAAAVPVAELERAISPDFIEAVERNAFIAPAAEVVEHETPAAQTSRGVPETHEHEAETKAAADAAPAAVSKPEEPDYEHGEAAAYYRGDSAPASGSAPAPVPTFVPVDPIAKNTYDSAVTYGLPEYESHDVWGSIRRKEPVVMVGDSWVPVIASAHQKDTEVQKVNMQDDVHEHLAQGEAGPSMPIPYPAKAKDATENGHGNGNGTIASPASSFKMPNPHPEDPFADPVMPIVSVSHSDDIYQHEVPAETHDDAIHAIVMPLPAFSDVAPPGSIRQAVSQSTYAGPKNIETDERIPLLHRPAGTGNKLDSFLQQSQVVTPNNYASISPLASTSQWQRHHHHNGSHTQGAPKLHELGWLEYSLPDGTVYYVHPTRKITTDAGLRVDYVLNGVEAWCERHSDETRDIGVECWLREVDAKDAAKKAAASKGKSASKGKAKKGESPPVFFERFWVDHHARTVVKAEDDERKVVGYARGHGHGKGKSISHASASKSDEDHLDLEYRFWSFIEAHPAHTTLPHKAKVEALDILTWAWTDRLLPSVRPVPPPFTQEECQELSTLLRSFNNDNKDHGIQTRVVARILLRVAHWRQSYFRPTKALPKDIGGIPGHLPVQRRTVRRAIFDFVLSCLCLGIPYIFLQRATRLSTRMDEESGVLRGGGPVVVIGAATCLVAAIVLSASVTFLSLPGLDNVARTTSLVAVIFAAFAMAATGVAVLKHKADMARPLSRMSGIEGLMLISRRSVAMSLPLVLLSYAVIAFVTAIVLYSFRGSPNKLPGGRDTFQDYMKWTVVGVVGALAGILTTSMVVLAR